MDHISWLGVGVGAIALFILAAIWYTALFGKAFRAELGVTETAGVPEGMGKALLGQFLTSLVMAILLAWLIADRSTGEATVIGLIVGLVVAAAQIQLYQFDGRSLRHLMINVGYLTVGLTMVGAIIGAL